MERRIRIPTTFSDGESVINSPFASPRFTSDTFSFTFRDHSTKLPPLRPVQHRLSRKPPKLHPLVSPRESRVKDNLRSLLSLRRFSAIVSSDKKPEDLRR